MHKMDHDRYIKILYISIVTPLILLFNSYSAYSQVFDSEQNPPGVHWSQINTENFQLIYPTEIEAEAQRMANTLEHVIMSISHSLNKKPRKISVILQNQGIVSNGFVQLAPRRSELFTTPPQNLEFQDWLNSVGVHELRHVVQIDKLTGQLKAPFFEELALAIFGITLPPWFYEGDAVGIETALSHAGRGRLPDWELIFRTNTLSKHLYSYSKDYFGSVKDPTPGYYQLGYFMTTKLRRDFGKDILDSIMSRVSNNPIRPYSLSNSIKKFTGLNSRTLHDSTVAELKRLWQKQADELSTISYPALNKRTDKYPADYLLPVTTESDDIIVLKHSKARTAAFVRIDAAGNEHLLLNIGYQMESNFKCSAGKIVWDEFRYDNRFQKRSFNVINIYDINKGEYKQLTHRSRLFSPCLSPDGKSIAVIKIGLDNAFKLVELDAKTGIEIRSYPNIYNYFLQTPAFNNEGDKLISVAVSKEGAALLETSRTDGSSRIILPFQRQQLSRPVYVNQNIIFSAHYNGLNNIYSISPGSQSIRVLTSVPFGAANPSYSLHTKKLLFNNYQVRGYDVAAVSLSGVQGPPLSNIHDTFINYAAPLVRQEGASSVLDSVPAIKYPVKPYRELKNLFYFHSLSPIAETNGNDDDSKLGLNLKSANKLNTLDFYAGYQFNTGLKRSEYLAGFTYKRFYPILDVKYTNQAHLLYTRQTIGNVSTLVPVNWRENFMELGLEVPFVFNGLNKTYHMGFKASSSYTSRYEVQNQPGNFISKLRFPLEYMVYMNRNTQRSARDLAPRWGQNFSLTYHHLPFEDKVNGTLLSFRSTFYTPGILLNHSFQASFNYQQNTDIYEFNIDIPKISGYNHLMPVKGLRNTLLLDYRFPLFYPDAELGPLAYIKRINGGFFADFENVGKGSAFEPRTYGVELRSDMNLLRFYLPNFDLGGKLIFVNDKTRKDPIFEISFSYDY